MSISSLSFIDDEQAVESKLQYLQRDHNEVSLSDIKSRSICTGRPIFIGWLAEVFHQV